jgi:signal transduction histidine kinase
VRLRSYTLSYFSVALLAILSVWAVIFYINMLDEVYDSLDDGLENYKFLVIEKAGRDTSVLYRTSFAESNYAIRAIPEQDALKVKDVYKDTLMYMENEDKLEPVRMLTTAFSVHKRYYELRVITSMVEEDDLIEDLLYALIWLYVAVLVSILAVNNLLLKKIWKPFYRLMDQLSAFRLGSRDTPVVTYPTKVDEFALLNDTVSGMLRQALETYSSQKQFIENASHELQTPLAISISKLELLAETTGLSEIQQASVQQVIRTLERMTRLNRSLLLLSRIENRQYIHVEEVDICAAVVELTEEFEDFAAFRQIRITVSQHAQLYVNMNRDLAVMLLSNLIKNAIVHSAQHATVEIMITAGAFTVCNPGTAPLDQHRIFERFYKGTAASETTGLGLPIVKAIAGLYGASVQYEYNGRHCMTLRF